MSERQLSDLEKQGLIQAFEYTYELSWNMLKDYLVWQGFSEITGSRDTFRLAFSQNLISDGETWMKMLIDRNKTLHTYNEVVANDIIGNITEQYHELFLDLIQTFKHIQQQYD